MNLYDHNYINIDGNWIHETAIIGENVVMGTGNILMPYSVVGEVGFIRGSKTKGRILIGNNNKVGCHVTIMSGEDGLTKIGDGNLIMNHVNIGHNTEVGNNNEIGAGSIISGHVKIGNRVQVKVHCSIRNRVEIEDNVVVGMNTNVTKSLKKNKVYYGNPVESRP